MLALWLGLCAWGGEIGVRLPAGDALVVAYPDGWRAEIEPQGMVLTGDGVVLLVSSDVVDTPVDDRTIRQGFAAVQSVVGPDPEVESHSRSFEGGRLLYDVFPDISDDSPVRAKPTGSLWHQYDAVTAGVVARPGLVVPITIFGNPAAPGHAEALDVAAGLVRRPCVAVVEDGHYVQGDLRLALPRGEEDWEARCWRAGAGGGPFLLAVNSLELSDATVDWTPRVAAEHAAGAILTAPGRPAELANTPPETRKYGGLWVTEFRVWGPSASDVDALHLLAAAQTASHIHVVHVVHRGTVESPFAAADRRRMIAMLRSVEIDPS